MNIHTLRYIEENVTTIVLSAYPPRDRATLRAGELGRSTSFSKEIEDKILYITNVRGKVTSTGKATHYALLDRLDRIIEIGELLVPTELKKDYLFSLEWIHIEDVN